MNTQTLHEIKQNLNQVVQKRSTCFKRNKNVWKDSPRTNKMDSRTVLTLYDVFGFEEQKAILRKMNMIHNCHSDYLMHSLKVRLFLTMNPYVTFDTLAYNFTYTEEQIMLNLILFHFCSIKDIEPERKAEYCSLVLSMFISQLHCMLSEIDGTNVHDIRGIYNYLDYFMILFFDSNASYLDSSDDFNLFRDCKYFSFMELKGDRIEREAYFWPIEFLSCNFFQKKFVSANMKTIHYSLNKIRIILRTKVDCSDERSFVPCFERDQRKVFQFLEGKSGQHLCKLYKRSFASKLNVKKNDL
eukprot:snap_masked-scaffold_72-processed-gene-0.37-mRNA-1 protein AED:1.00 eAED:1.00 QI:0/-1/0/0/-1/1/1/0/298